MFLRERNPQMKANTTDSSETHMVTSGNADLRHLCRDEQDEWTGTADGAKNRPRRGRPWRFKFSRNHVVHLVRVTCAIATLLISAAMMRKKAMQHVVSAVGEMHPQDAIPSKFTAMINTFRRPRQLEQALRHYATCDCIEAIRVTWSELTPPPGPSDRPDLFELGKNVRFDAHQTTSLNNRFRFPSGLTTDAVFVVDDDIEVPCDHLAAAFGTWNRHRDSLVGFFPRSHGFSGSTDASSNDGEGSGSWEYLYFWRVLWHMEYSMVLTKAAFLHSKYLKLYSGVDDASLSIGDTSTGGLGIGDRSNMLVTTAAKARAYVDHHRNCEDIAMQMLATTVSGVPPVTVFAPIRDHGVSRGISTSEGSGRWWKAPHAIKRSKCLQDLHDIFVANVPSKNPGETRPSAKPLVHTSFFASTQRRGLGAPRDDNAGEGDLSHLSRFALAIRAPTLAEFISADMLLVPARIWRWLAEDDLLAKYHSGT